jgi:DNA-binding transcriptional regulator YiaG
MSARSWRSAVTLLSFCTTMNKNNVTRDGMLRELRILGMRRKAKVTPSQVCAAREFSGLTQRECALLMATSTRSWQQWESGARSMKGRDFEFFCLLTHSHQTRVALQKLKVKRV